jgi:hypothetical protein
MFWQPADDLMTIVALSIQDATGGLEHCKLLHKVPEGKIYITQEEVSGHVLIVKNTRINQDGLFRSK